MKMWMWLLWVILGLLTMYITSKGENLRAIVFVIGQLSVAVIVAGNRVAEAIRDKQ